MYNRIHPLDCFIKNTHFGEILDLHEIQLRGVLRPRGLHLLSLLQGPRRAADGDAAGQEVVHDVGADEARGAGDEDVSG